METEYYPQSTIEIGSVPVDQLVTCGTCGRRFPDIYPSGRCPFEYEHENDENTRPLTEAEQFFYDNAVYSYNPEMETEEQGHVQTAKELAIAEAKLKAGPYFIQTEPDPFPWDGDEPYDGPLLMVSLWSVENEIHPELLGSIGSVACPDGDTDPYVRVVAAELACEYIK